MNEYEKLIVTCLLAGVLSNNNSWGMDSDTPSTNNNRPLSNNILVENKNGGPSTPSATDDDCCCLRLCGGKRSKAISLSDSNEQNKD